GLWSARSLVKLGKWVEAAERYLEVTRLDAWGGDMTVQKQAQVDAQADLVALQPKIPSVVFAVDGAAPSEVKITIDGDPVAPELIGEARPVNPGRHQISGVRGSERANVEVVVREGEKRSALLHFDGSTRGTAPLGATRGTAPPPSLAAED